MRAFVGTCVGSDTGGGWVGGGVFVMGARRAGSESKPAHIAPVRPVIDLRDIAPARKLVLAFPSKALATRADLQSAGYVRVLLKRISVY